MHRHHLLVFEQYHLLTAAAAALTQESSFSCYADLCRSVLDLLVTHKFNVLRLPFSLPLALDPLTTIPAYNCYECVTDKAWDALDRLFNKAAARGIMIILDLHNFDKVRTFWVVLHNEGWRIKKFALL